MANENEHTFWHPAFRSAIALEFEQYKDVLEFQFEIPLNREPLIIDAIIIKKLKDVVIHKHIAKIFRTYNIVEFKSSSDWLSVKDFYTVYAYACLFSTVTAGASITDISVTFIENRHPRDFIRHLEEVRGYRVSEVHDGIYLVKGDILPIQILESKRLDETEYVWLGNLRDNLDAADIRTLVPQAESRKKIR
jgi:hypothetical protein